MNVQKFLRLRADSMASTGEGKEWQIKGKGKKRKKKGEVKKERIRERGKGKEGRR